MSLPDSPDKSVFVHGQPNPVLEEVTEPQVTIVVSPRERFSYTQQSLDSIYEHTQLPFKLIYVDGNSPTQVRKYLEVQAQAKGFQLIRSSQYLYPNQARNIGLRQVQTKYVAFVDNDVIVNKGWLTHLVRCAEETSATVVGPLMCQDEPVHQTIHFAGGESHIWQDTAGETVRRRLREKMYRQGKQMAEVCNQLERQQTELAEFHCVLVRRSIFERIGLLDEQMLNTKEHLDFCMTVAQAGGTVYFEPKSVATYVPGPPLDWSDLHFYMLRWSDAWQLNSLNHLREKWNLAEDGYFKAKYKKLGWRRRKTVLKPLSRRLTFGIKSGVVENLLAPVDKVFNRYLTDRHAQGQRRWLRQKPVQPESNSEAVFPS
jgi:GT2 family glycosyltransferase